MCRIHVLARLRGFRAAAFLVALGLSLSMLTTAAEAHAVLLSSTPEQGERLSVSPNAVTLHFSESVTQVMTTLTSRDRRPVVLPVKVSGAEVTAELAKPLPPGAYAFSWRAVSEDGHPVAASIVFAVGKDAILAGLPGTAPHGWLDIATLGTKFTFYAACLFGVGRGVFSIWIARSPPSPSTSVLLLIGAACALLLVALLGLEESGSPLEALAGAEPWLMAARTSLARSLALAGGSLSFAFLAGHCPNWGRTLSSVSLVLLGVAFALTGHASGAGVPWLSSAAVSAHVTAVCFWAGALPGLFTILRSDHTGRAQTLTRFSSAIPFSVAMMVVAGGYLAYVQVGTPSGFLHTDYGKILILKLALVASALVLGAWNRAFLTSRVEQGSLSAANTMKMIVFAEILLITLVLAVTSLWRFTPPPRALALRPTIASIHIHGASAMATMSFKTMADLSFDLDLSLETGDFDPLDPHEVRFRMSAADGSIAPFDVPVRRVSPSSWRARRIQVPCDCQWKIRIDALVSDFDMVTLNGNVKLLSPN